MRPEGQLLPQRSPDEDGAEEAERCLARPARAPGAAAGGIVSRLDSPVGADDHVEGPRSAPIILVEYGDFQCPTCAAAYEEVKDLRRALRRSIRFVYRHFPVTEIHPFASNAAEAAEAAGAQGKFWEMHDLLYENQDAIDPDAFDELADAIGLDILPFSRDLADHRFLEKARRDFRSGSRSGVRGTPGFYVNGERHDGLATAESLLRTIELRERSLRE